MKWIAPDRWNLTPDGEPFSTASSDLFPVRYESAPAMLKIAKHPEEQAGNALMIWWNGEGAARVLACDGHSLLLERATGSRSLAEMARDGFDREASAIICSVAEKLHSPRPQPPPKLTPLTQWFRELEPAAHRLEGVLRQSLNASRELLATPREIVVLHGDIHHGNILDAGPRGWLAIDPKGLIGERGFDFANIFCNPDWTVATTPGRLAEQATVVAEAAGLDRRRLLKWILAYAGLSAVWSLADNEDPSLALTVASLAARGLANQD